MTVRVGDLIVNPDYDERDDDSVYGRNVLRLIDGQASLLSWDSPNRSQKIAITKLVAVKSGVWALKAD